MKRLLCPRIPAPDKPVELPESEAEHATRVLRLRDGDEVEALDGRGGAARVVLRVRGGPVRLEYAGPSSGSAEPGTGAIPPVTLEMGILKGDAMEWAIEKAVEIGARHFIPVVTAHTVVQLKQKGPEAFKIRWQKIADQALKQCGRLERMEIQDPIELESLMARNPSSAREPRIWCDEAARGEAQELGPWLSQSRPQALRILIGPEGGWSQSEREMLSASGAVRASLGPWVLRAETAALFTLSLAASHFRQDLERQGAAKS